MRNSNVHAGVEVEFYTFLTSVSDRSMSAFLPPRKYVAGPVNPYPANVENMVSS
jgi:hypothetical protein